VLSVLIPSVVALRLVQLRKGWMKVELTLGRSLWPRSA
jgi:hypothetical protein